MKKQIIVLMFMLVLVGGIIAGDVLLKKDKDIKLTKEQKKMYKDKGIEPTYEDNNIGVDEVQRCLISNTNFNLPCQRFNTFYTVCGLINETIDESGHQDGTCLRFDRIDYTPEELEQQMDDWTVEKLGYIADTEEVRKEDKTKTKIREGNITIKEK